MWSCPVLLGWVRIVFVYLCSSVSPPHLPGPGLGVPVSSRVSTKIQQLLNTLKRPKRPPLSEFFMDDQEEIVEGVWLHVHNIPVPGCTHTYTQRCLVSFDDEVPLCV